MRRAAARSLAACLLVAAAMSLRAAGEDGGPPWERLNREGVEAYLRGDLPGAVERFRRAAADRGAPQAVRTNLARACTALGRAHSEEGRTEAALPLLEEAMAADPDCAVARCDWADAMLSAGRPADLLARLDPREERNASVPQLLARLGEAQRLGGDREGAIATWERALSLEEDAAFRARLEALRADAELERDHRHLRAHHFLLSYDTAVPHRWRMAVLHYLDRAYDRVALDLGHRPRLPVQVVVTPERRFREVLGGHAWAGGTFDGRIRIPHRQGEDPSAVESVVFHEVAHAVLADLWPDAPVWLQEGIAQRSERTTDAPRSDPEPFLRAAAASGRLLPWETMQEEFLGLDAEAAQVAYAQAYGLLLHLEGRYGLARLRRWIRAAAGEGEEAAAAREFRASPRDLFRQWQDGLREEGVGG